MFEAHLRRIVGQQPLAPSLIALKSHLAAVVYFTAPRPCLCTFRPVCHRQANSRALGVPFLLLAPNLGAPVNVRIGQLTSTLFSTCSITFSW
jgi:hypothetical protein